MPDRCADLQMIVRYVARAEPGSQGARKKKCDDLMWTGKQTDKFISARDRDNDTPSMQKHRKHSIKPSEHIHFLHVNLKVTIPHWLALSRFKLKL